eukprot:TRINITY_DN2095_c0_g1_i1.p1 TRINITY_DN2095_c0_g1~~TRINITY_DN2095_c0_g1_i1.p1  ORF type:complete len:381 (+),score=76.29 TRINITY_DN2095_c0_g1_i1:72-1214(+)
MEGDERAAFEGGKRKRIREIQADETLTSVEKAKMVQNLMSAHFLSSSTQLPTANEDVIKKTYADEEEELLGCIHYQRGCRYKSTCCERVFTCRQCHDAEIKDHHFPRFDTKEMWCMHCDTMQPIAKDCANCKTELGVYYCGVCHFHDNSGRAVFHCDDCGLCRVGKGLGIDYIHCQVCNICVTKDGHNPDECRQDKMAGNCPICHEDLFTSTKSMTGLKCGHAIHVECFQELRRNSAIVCPVCNKSLYGAEDMTAANEAMDNYLCTLQMPEEFKDTEANILCNDCLEKTTVPYHYVAHKCLKCLSYNTRVLDVKGMPEFEANGPRLPGGGRDSDSGGDGDGDGDDADGGDGGSEDGDGGSEDGDGGSEGGDNEVLSPSVD